jgi:hypothetical protein
VIAGYPRDFDISSEDRFEFRRRRSEMSKHIRSRAMRRAEVCAIPPSDSPVATDIEADLNGSTPEQ